MKKTDIRKKLLIIRKRKYDESLKVNPSKFLKFLREKNLKSKDIGGYYPFNSEFNILNILSVLEKKKYQISLPIISRNKKMDFFRWTIFDPLKINKYGIPEPISKKKIYPKILLIPLVGFDDQLNRLGYGGGFYDRYISKYSDKYKITKIGFGFSFQKIKNLPVNKFDKKLDYILTEKNFF